MTDHDTTAVLAHHLGRLDADACAALVADLWTARGFETSRDERWVVATGRGPSLRIRVGTPVESTATDPPDVVVSPRSDRSAREAARTTGARFLDAAALAEMLRYAVDRETATALCARHLGAPLEDLRPPLGERLRARLDRLRWATLADACDSAAGLDHGTVPVFGLVLVLLFGTIAGVALTGTPGGGIDGAAGVEPPSVPESTPVGDTDVGTATPTLDPGPSVVPGLSEDGIVDLSVLAAAHARGLLGRSYALWMDTYRPPPDDRDGPPVQFDTDVVVAGDRFLVEENVGDDETRRRLRAVYHDGEAWFVADETADGTTYKRVGSDDPSPLRPSSHPDNVALGLVADYLSTPATSVEGRVEGSGVGEPTLYRVVGQGVPPPMAGDGVRNYTAVALVDRDGVVRDLTVTYTVVTGTERYRVRKEWTYGYLGETIVGPPAWYDERFAANATASPTPES